MKVEEEPLGSEHVIAYKQAQRTNRCVTRKCASRQPVRRSQNATGSSALVLRLRPLILFGRWRGEERQPCTCSEALPVRLAKTTETLPRNTVGRKYASENNAEQDSRRRNPCRAQESGITVGCAQCSLESAHYDGTGAQRPSGQMSTAASTRDSSDPGVHCRPGGQ